MAILIQLEPGMLPQVFTDGKEVVSVIIHDLYEDELYEPELILDRDLVDEAFDNL